MPASRRHQRRGRVFIAGLTLGLAVVFSGCGTTSPRPTAPAETVSLTFPTYVAPARVVVGRVLSHDAAQGGAVVELSPFSTAPADLAGVALIARHPDTLAPTAELLASSRRTGNLLGVRVKSGAPAPGDEVVLPPPR
jgi:hypothetical protein